MDSPTIYYIKPNNLPSGMQPKTFKKLSDLLTSLRSPEKINEVFQALCSFYVYCYTRKGVTPNLLISMLYNDLSIRGLPFNKFVDQFYHLLFLQHIRYKMNRNDLLFMYNVKYLKEEIEEDETSEC